MMMTSIFAADGGLFLTFHFFRQLRPIPDSVKATRLVDITGDCRPDEMSGLHGEYQANGSPHPDGTRREFRQIQLSNVPLLFQ